MPVDVPNARSRRTRANGVAEVLYRLRVEKPLRRAASPAFEGMTAAVGEVPIADIATVPPDVSGSRSARGSRVAQVLGRPHSCSRCMELAFIAQSRWRRVTLPCSAQVAAPLSNCAWPIMAVMSSPLIS